MELDLFFTEFSKLVWCRVTATVDVTDFAFLQAGTNELAIDIEQVDGVQF